MVAASPLGFEVLYFWAVVIAAGIQLLPWLLLSVYIHQVKQVFRLLEFFR
jgi:hypothetical protein